MRSTRLPIALVLLQLTMFVPARAGDRAVLTFEERVACTQRVSTILDAAREGSSGNGVAREVARAQALDAVRKSNALARIYDRPVTGAMLGAELERIMARTKAPKVLDDVLGALGYDPTLAAECMARPLLAERLLRDAFSADAAIHQPVIDAARSAIANSVSVAALRRVAPRATAVTYRQGSERGPARNGSRAWVLPSTELEAVRERAADGLHPDAVVDTGSELSLTVTLQDHGSYLRVLRLAWPKRTFEDWWRGVAPAMGTEPDESVSSPAEMPAAVPPAPGTWSAIAGGPPEPRKLHTMVWTGREAIVWGGVSSALGGSTATGGRYDTLTDTWTPTWAVGAPDKRSQHVAVWTGSEMFVWGGFKGVGEGALLVPGGLYNPATDTWRPVSTIGAPSSPSSGQTAVWTGSHVIVMGADTSPAVHLYDPAEDQWSQTAAPLPMRFHKAIWTGSRMLAWGGTSLGAPNPVGLSYDPAANVWSVLPPPPANPRTTGHTVVWTGDEMIVWGGGGNDSQTSRVPGTGAAYNPDTGLWRPVSPIGAPAARGWHVAGWAGGRMLVWGGRSGGAAERTAFPEGGVYDPATDTWEPMSALPATAGGGLIDGAAVSFDGTFLVWGGEHGQIEHSSGGMYSPHTDTWTALGVHSAPSGRATHRPVWTGAELIIWGGGAGYPTRDGRRYLPAFDAWLPLPMTGAPSARDVFEAVWTGDEMIVWSGFTEAWTTGASLPRSGGRYDPVSDSWTAMTETGAPTGRFWAASAWTGSEMFVWGGYNGGDLASGGLYDPATDKWRDVSLAGAPRARSEHEIVWSGSKAIVWGGFPAMNSGGMYDPASNTWTATTNEGAPAVRYRFSSVMLDGKMIVWGGLGTEFYASGGSFDPTTNSWSAIADGPYRSYMHRASPAGDRMIVWGGYASGTKREGAIYVPGTNTWSPTPADGAPLGRYLHAQAWSGEGLLIWGGNPTQGGGAFLYAP